MDRSIETDSIVIGTGVDVALQVRTEVLDPDHDGIARLDAMG